MKTLADLILNQNTLSQVEFWYDCNEVDWNTYQIYFKLWNNNRFGNHSMKPKKGGVINDC